MTPYGIIFDPTPHQAEGRRGEEVSKLCAGRHISWIAGIDTDVSKPLNHYEGIDFNGFV